LFIFNAIVHANAFSDPKLELFFNHHRLSNRNLHLLPYFYREFEFVFKFNVNPFSF